VISQILKDDTPKGVSYVFTVKQLSDEFAGITDLDDLALYALYHSTPQTRKYDATVSNDERYAVMVLINGLPVLDVPTMPGDLADKEEARSILLFPVKARLKKMIASAVEEQGMRAVKAFLSVPLEKRSIQKPLVLVFDETTQKITPRFAPPWDGEEKDRIYG
jgi:hypothetical protein